MERESDWGGDLGLGVSLEERAVREGWSSESLLMDCTFKFKFRSLVVSGKSITSYAVRRYGFVSKAGSVWRIASVMSPLVGVTIEPWPYD